MAKEDKSDESMQGYADPLYLSSADNPGTQITNFIFNGENFLNWSRSIRMSLGSKNKLGYIEGTIKEPERDTKDYQKWSRNDYMVRSWIFKSMNEKLADSLILCESAKQLWDELIERYSVSSAPHLYALKRELTKIQQGEGSVAEYYCKLKQVTDEIASLEAYPICECEAKKVCSCNLLKKVMEMQEKIKVIDFLMGLNVRKNQGVVANIIGMDPLPNLSRAYHIAQQAEKQRMMQESIEEAKEHEVSAFNMARIRNKPIRQISKEEKKKLKCDYCGKRGHEMKGCFVLNGYPEWWKGSTSSNGGKMVANVIKEDFEDDPLASPKAEGSSNTSNTELVNTVVQEVMKAMEARASQGKHNHGFAGPPL